MPERCVGLTVTKEGPFSMISRNLAQAEYMHVYAFPAERSCASRYPLARRMKVGQWVWGYENKWNSRRVQAGLLSRWLCGHKDEGTFKAEFEERDKRVGD